MQRCRLLVPRTQVDRKSKRRGEEAARLGLLGQLGPDTKGTGGPHGSSIQVNSGGNFRAQKHSCDLLLVGKTPPCFCGWTRAKNTDGMIQHVHINPLNYAAIAPAGQQKEDNGDTSLNETNSYSRSIHTVHKGRRSVDLPLTDPAPGCSPEDRRRPRSSVRQRFV